MLFLVRHAMPVVRPDRPPHEWPLSPPGRAAAARLAAALPLEAYLVASAEPKAYQTLAVAGPVQRDPRLNEVSRDEPFDSDFQTARRGYVQCAVPRGWEPPAQVAARFAAAIAAHTAASAGRPLVVASHGMAMTTWLAATVGLADPGQFWAELRLPDLLRVDLAAGLVARIDLEPSADS